MPKSCQIFKNICEIFEFGSVCPEPALIFLQIFKNLKLEDVWPNPVKSSKKFVKFLNLGRIPRTCLNFLEKFEKF